jgi:hypothetical protein
LRQFFTAQVWLRRKSAERQRNFAIAVRVAHHSKKKDFEQYIDSLLDDDLKQPIKSVTADNASDFGFEMKEEKDAE